MSNKNEIITSEDLLAKMRKGVKEIHEISLRGFVIQVRVLSVNEMNEVRRNSYLEAIKIKGDEVDKNLISQKTILKLASTSPTSGGVPLLSDKVLDLMTTDEINYLYDEYVRVCDVVNPSIETISPELFHRLVDDLKKNVLSVNDLSLPQLKAICSSLLEAIIQKDS